LLPVPVAGLAQLKRCPPLWGDRLEWTELVASLRAFEERWGKIAESAGWSLLQLYGLDPDAPRARVGRMGAAFLACMPGRQVIAVDDRAITVVTRTASRLRIFRGDGAGAVLAWEL
jgi:hypothetical protein